MTGNELVQFQPTENFISNIADLSDIIDDDESLDSIPQNLPLAQNLPVTQSLPFTVPISSEAIDIIDPMSFINTTPVTLNTEENESSVVLDTPLVLEPVDEIL